MPYLTRLSAICKMFNAETGATVKASNGELVYSWVLTDIEGNVVYLPSMTDEQIIEAYDTFLDWRAPNQ